MSVFKAHCPKCNSMHVSLTKDRHARWGTQVGGKSVFHCHNCGKQLFAEVAEAEVAAQQVKWEAAEAIAIAQQKEELQRREEAAQRQALWLAQKQAEAEVKRLALAEQDRQAQITLCLEAQKTTEAQKTGLDRIRAVLLRIMVDPPIFIEPEVKVLEVEPPKEEPPPEIVIWNPPVERAPPRILGAGPMPFLTVEAIRERLTAAP